MISGYQKSPQRENFEEARAEHNRMIEKHGKAETKVEQPDGSMATISGYDCPDCEDGVKVVSPRNNQYPPFEKKCINGGC